MKKITNLSLLKLFVFINLIIICTAGVGQTPTAELPKVIGPSPNAASIQRFGEYKAGTYTGIAPISIPLYNISLKDISIPISISYRSSGIRVDEESSRVGLGWNLSAGGVISRNIMGLDDL